MDYFPQELLSEYANPLFPEEVYLELFARLNITPELHKFLVIDTFILQNRLLLLYLAESGVDFVKLFVPNPKLKKEFKLIRNTLKNELQEVYYLINDNVSNLGREPEYFIEGVFGVIILNFFLIDHFELIA